MRTHKICYFAGTAGDWGGASRVLFTNLRLLDRSRYEPFVLLSGHGPAEKILDDLRIPHAVWGPLTELGHPVSYLTAVIRTANWYRKHEIELVHMNRANDWRPAEILAARLCRIPVIYHFHTVNHDRAPATRWASAIFAVSNYVAEHSDTLGVPVKVIHNTVDMSRFKQAKNIRGSVGLDERHVVVAFVGQIRKIKGVDDFVAMARDVAGDHVRFLIAGECRDKRTAGDTFTEEELHALISTAPRILYCGYQARIQDVYRSSDIVVVPSRWEEPFGLVIIEAGASGKPVVATRTGGIPEVIEDGVTGYLVNAGDVQALANRVQQLVDDPGIRSKMREAARTRVHQEFTSKPIQILETSYTSLLI